DLFLFDAYGVFWEGNGFYKSSRETMEQLVCMGKTVAIISNTTMLQKDIITSYTKRGLLQNRDYNYIVTSGDLLRSHLLMGNIKFECCPNPLKYYVIGLEHKKAFKDSKYTITENLKEADFVYCGVPFLFAEDVAKYPQYQDQYWPVKNDESNGVKMWDTLTLEPFKEIVDEAVYLHKPVLNANPDFTAKEGHPLIPDAPAVFVVRNGTIAEMFRQRGAEVLEFGKPHRNIYDYTFKVLQEKGVQLDKSRTCMVGDTVRTDIKGGINAGITPILCVETGVTAEEILNGKSVESLCKIENIDVNQIIQIKSVGGK
ncbi:MAG: HAD hydrolase-like protein, partial [Alphaproteobacteria bacterium]|nr:HAD hydrolase-like protein [Alphaproteobacteria bacterium]